MSYVAENPLVVQSDHTLLLEVQAPRASDARDALLGFAELIKSPEYIHTWRLTPLSLWNAAAAGRSPDDVVDTLRAFAKYPVPDVVETSVRHHMGRYGALRLVQDGEWLRLEADSATDLTEVTTLKGADGLFGTPLSPTSVQVHPRRRGELKQVLVAAGHPVEDLVGYEDGDALKMAFDHNREGSPWSLRDYQVDAVDSFTQGPTGGSGVIVLPCGAGKTMVGIGAMVRLGMRTLILCTGHTALQQWKREILARTTLRLEDVGEYSSRIKELRPVTLTTYQLLTWRESKSSPPAHFRLFYEANWGLIVYDEVHLLPAPIFREAAYLQARRRLGLTATLVREDGREGDVFALVGPKRYDLPWKELERQGWIATAQCIEVRVPLSDADRIKYVQAGGRARFAIAAKNPRKGPVIDTLLERHKGSPLLLLGTYLEQLEWVARRLGVPVITGKTPHKERDAIFEQFRMGTITVLALSKVGNFAIDLPGASVAVQISGTWGSRQEEAQRLGRVLRPKDGVNQAFFYTLVSSETREQEVAEWRQLFLAEQGYPYRVELIS